MKLSIIIPAYNEERYILEILKKVKNVDFGLEKEVIVVNDASKDKTGEILNSVEDLKVFTHSKNKGKGAALRTGFANATGDIIAIQDADLEYNPEDLKALVHLVADGDAEVVYGSRMTGKNPIGHIAYYLGNQLISGVTRILYGVKLTDVETCYKVFTKNVLTKLNLSENDFGFEVEFTAQVLRGGFKVRELSISYAPRKFNEGKKISWVDGIKAVWLLFKYKFFNAKH